MKRYNPIWLSAVDNFNGWQYRRYVAYRRKSAQPPTPPLPTWSTPYSIAWYRGVNPYNSFVRTNLRSVNLNNNGTHLTYWVIDQSTPNFNVYMNVANKAGIIYHIKPIDGKEYISCSSPSSDDVVLKGATALPMARVGAIACISEYKQGKPDYDALFEDLEYYRKFIRLEGEVVNNVSYAAHNSKFYVNGYEYKTHENSFFNQLFSTPDTLHEGELHYDGFNYHEKQFEMQDIVEPITSINKTLPVASFANSVSLGSNTLTKNSRLPMLWPTTWANNSDYDGSWFPKNFTFDEASNTTITNQSYGWGANVTKNPYLPAGGSQNAYEFQTIFYVDRGSNNGGRMFHAVTRYWWCPKEAPQ